MFKKLLTGTIGRRLARPLLDRVFSQVASIGATFGVTVDQISTIEAAITIVVGLLADTVVRRINKKEGA